MKIVCAILAGLLLTVPISAQETLSPAQAETRLRGCLQAGAGGAPRTGLRAAVVAVRALCKPQIDRVADNRIADATQGLTGDEAEQARQSAILQLNDEIARAIANFTGLRTL
ncbi:hypothetical protein AAG604_15920 [Citromicrobium bathyomarinum]